MEQAGKATIPIIESSYHKTAQKLGEIAKQAPIYGVLGNHDLTFAYDSLEGIVQHLEKVGPVKIKNPNRSKLWGIF
jgi:predicted MPP superfamily phosphohydrolase